MKCYKCRRRQSEFYTVCNNVFLLNCVECSYKLNKAFPETNKTTHLVPKADNEENYDSAG